MFLVVIAAVKFFMQRNTTLQTWEAVPAMPAFIETSTTTVLAGRVLRNRRRSSQVKPVNPQGTRPDVNCSFMLDDDYLNIAK